MLVYWLTRTSGNERCPASGFHRNPKPVEGGRLSPGRGGEKPPAGAWKRAWQGAHWLVMQLEKEVLPRCSASQLSQI